MATTLTEQLNFHFTSQMIARILCLPTIQSLNSEQLVGGAEASPAWWPASTVLSGCAHTPPTGKEPRDLSSTSTSCPMLCMRACSVTSIVSDALQPRGLQLTRLLSMQFSRQEYWSELPCLPPGDLPNPGIKPASPALQADSLLLSLQGSTRDDYTMC